MPFLPLYVQSMGVTDQAEVVEWSGYAFGATFLAAAIVSPIWGRLADRHGRKPMLLRASLGMAVVMSLLGLAQTPLQLVLGRLCMGLVAGYVSAAMTLVATQTPATHSGRALGTLVSGAVAGNLLGPLLGGWLAETIGLRHTFFVTGAFLFVAFLVTVRYVHEDFHFKASDTPAWSELWRAIAQPRMMIAMFGSAFLFQVANMSIEPIVTVYIGELLSGAAHVAMTSGLVVSAAAFATMLASARLGRLADRFGPDRVLVTGLAGSALTLLPQAFVTNVWQLMVLRFLMGLTLAGVLPAISSLVRRYVPANGLGRFFSYLQSAQFFGEIAGPVAGGHLAALIGLRSVFVSTAFVMLFNAAWVGWARLQHRRPGHAPLTR